MAKVSLKLYKTGKLYLHVGERTVFRSELVALYFNEWNIISTTPNG